jgi:uncharacterized protein (TIRG00374 family)
MTEGRAPALRTWAIRIAIGLAVSGLIVVALFTQIDAGAVGTVLSRSSPPLLALGFAVYVVLVTLRAWRFRVLMPDAPFGPLLAVSTIHLLLLRIMPMRTGELGFAWLMNKSGAAGFAKSLVGLVVLRVLDLATVAVFYGASVSLSAQGEDPHTLGVALGVLAAGVLMTALLLPALRLGRRVLDRSVVLFRLDRFARVEKVRRSIGDAVEWASALPKPTLARVTALTLVQWFVSFSLVLVLALAMRLDVGAAEAVNGGVGTIVTTMLPVPGIGTVGTLEAGWAAGFALAGVPQEEAIATAFGYSAISFAFTLVTSLPAWAWLARRR